MQVNTYTQIASFNAGVSNKKAEQTNAEKADVANNNQQGTKLDKDSLEELKALGGKGIAQAYFMEFSAMSLQVSFSNSSASGAIFDSLSGMNPAFASKILGQIDFAAIGYSGKNPLQMNGDELNALISDDGFFGVENTANRIADFIIQGAGDDLEKLQKGFEGMKRGFEQAGQIWGSKLPQISQDTMAMATEKLSKRIDELGGNTLNLQA